MHKWNMIVDVAKCENCHNCFLVTKDEHVGNEFPGYAAPQPLHGHRWIDVRRKERGQFPMIDVHFMPVMCNQCDNAPCIKAGKDGAVYKRDDGIVIIDPVKSKAQKQIVASCPYGAIFWNEELQLPQKWIFDAHLLDEGWRRTRVEQVCGTGVFRSVKVTDQEMEQIAAQEKLEVLRPELKLKPRVYYKNLHLMTKAFIGGTLIRYAGGEEECARDVQVTLGRNGKALAQTVTDEFGDFRFDNIDPAGGPYEVTILPSAAAKSLVVTVDASQKEYVGIIDISAA